MTRDQLELYTLAEAAELWHVSARTVRRWVDQGEIPHVWLGGQRRISGAVIERVARGEPAIVVATLHRLERSDR